MSGLHDAPALVCLLCEALPLDGHSEHNAARLTSSTRLLPATPRPFLKISAISARVGVLEAPGAPGTALPTAAPYTGAPMTGACEAERSEAQSDPRSEPRSVASACNSFCLSASNSSRVSVPSLSSLFRFSSLARSTTMGKTAHGRSSSVCDDRALDGEPPRLRGAWVAARNRAVSVAVPVVLQDVTPKRPNFYSLDTY